MNEDQIIEAARRERLNQGLLSLASWCRAHAHAMSYNNTDRCTETTLDMLCLMIKKLPRQVAKAGEDALEKFRDNQTQP
jgi:hypothetical protein